ncbi:MAG: hypothetical protein A3G41_05730 [Elusimicrobia bacterium RIFCSPLOWO2_12_FULL_59_9]|nr:MAG: hypothetical protein A3G41_05730 [Elusimicrobia bacterium RIFCSPLOWO2_12_FULL_59_9]
MRRLIIGGGEPTLWQNLTGVVQLAREMGFAEVQVQTNARLLSYLSTCRELVESGVAGYSVGVHGASSAAHDFLTKTPGSLVQTLAGIQNLKRLGQRVVVNTWIVKSNYRNLGEIVRLLAALKVDAVRMAFVRVPGGMTDQEDWLVAKQEMAGSQIRSAVIVAQRQGLPLSIAGVPPCVLGGDAGAQSVCASFAQISFDSDAPCSWTNSHTAKGPECKRCRLFDDCAGAPVEYTERYGWSEFRPV